MESITSNISSQLSIIQYVGCVFSVYPFPLWWLREYIYMYIYILCLNIIIKSEIWTITHCLGSGHEIMVCAVCLSIFLWICDMAGFLRGTFVSWWYLPRIWPPVTDMQHYNHARYRTDDWRLAYMFPHSVSTRRGPCVTLFPLWWLREYIYTLSYYHHQIGNMNYHSLFRIRSWNNGVRCMSLYILTIL